MNIPKINIKSMSRDELQADLVDRGLKKFRAGQILTWVYTHYARSFEEMTNIPKMERALLSSVFFISTPDIVRTESSKDGTRKFLFALEDTHTIESVLIPDEDRQTLCISSQVGCQQACRFCLTGSKGFTRDLKTYEIVDQVLEISRILQQEGKRRITNIVLMGMGEPLANFDQVLKALQVIASDKGLGFATRRDPA